VENPLLGIQTSSCMREFTLERSPISVVSVVKPLAGSHNSPSMREFTLGRSPISVIYVENVLS
jgi:hypothetical protein